MPTRTNLSAIWKQFKPDTLGRLAVVETAAEALQRNELSLELRHRAEREAHTLAG
jgi:hypothetical protein